MLKELVRSMGWLVTRCVDSDQLRGLILILHDFGLRNVCNVLAVSLRFGKSPVQVVHG